MQCFMGEKVYWKWPPMNPIDMTTFPPVDGERQQHPFDFLLDFAGVAGVERLPHRHQCLEVICPEMENFENNNAPQEEGIQLRALLERCLSKWLWFAVSLGAALLIAVFYILRTPSKYTTTAEVQIKSDSKGNSISNDIGDFSMGMFTTNSSVQNEQRAFQSSDLMSEVVDRLQLYMQYSTSGLFHPTVLYGSTLPISAQLLDVDDQYAASFTMQLADSTVKMRDFFLKEDKMPSETMEGAVGDTVQTPIGRIVLAKTQYFPTEGFKEP